MQASNVSEVVQSKSLEALDGALATLINKTVSGIDSATAFLGEQIPDVIHQLLMWEAISNGVLAVLLTIPLLIFIVVMKKGLWLGEHDQHGWYEKSQRGWCRDSKGDFLEDGLARATVPTIFACGMFSLSLEYYGVVLKILIAPKLFLIEYAATLLK